MTGKPKLLPLALLTIICLCPAATCRAGWLARLGEAHCFGWLLPKTDPCPTYADRLRRAGHPFAISRFARSTYGPDYSAYYVGGGAALHADRASFFRGEHRFHHEGTFGVDYDPFWSRVQLRWFHGRRYQGGEGQYEPDERNNPFAHFPD